MMKKCRKDRRQVLELKAVGKTSRLVEFSIATDQLTVNTNICFGMGQNEVRLNELITRLLIILH